MTPYPFALSLNTAIQVSAGADGYCLAPEGADTSPGVISSMVTLPSGSGIGDALAHLREGGATAAALVQTLVDRQGPAAGEQLAVVLQELDQRGWLNYAVLPLAIAEPLADSATLDLDIPHWSQANVSLSRFAYQRSHGGGMVLESPLSKFRIKLTDWRASAILAQLAQPQPLRRLTPPPQIGPETAYQFLNLLWATGFLSLEAAEAPELQLWEFHNLLFHSRSRQGRHDYPTGDIAASVGVWDQFPVVKPPLAGTIVPLPQFSIDAIRQRDKTLTTALEKRQSMREYDDHRPITVEQLGEFLYRTARVKEIYTLEAEQQALSKAEFGEAFDWGELSRRPYPCGGAMYELEIYPVVRHCAGVNPGLYHYDPLNHHLVQLDAAEADLQALLQDAHQSSGAQGVPQVLLIITARFGRLFRKYRSLAYALVLKHVGVLYENFYLVATAMDLAPCALGAGDSDRFAQATGLDYVVESSVGEFMLGSRANRVLDPSAIEPPPPEQTVASEATVEPMEDRDMALSSDEPDQAASAAAIAPPASSASPVSPAPLPPVSPSPLPPLALHPHDLDDRIPGLADLRNHTLGDPRITIVILDGNPDHSLSCFDGAEISKVFPYWHPAAEPVPQEAYLKFQEIDNDDTLDKDQKAEAQKAAFPEDILRRIHGDNHACHITSTIVGQENTPSPGLAPRCRVINVPLNTSSDNEEFISPLNLARAFELALDLGANIIHCAACRPTQTGEGEELLLQALKKCLNQNILIVAPAGNNEGECWCMPATLPGVLSVGALKPDGKPYKFSNWGGNNALEGIMAPGGEILGAQPANEAPVRLKGTSMAAPVMTGLCGLLMSRQLQQGKPLDAEAIRAALLNTALPCTPDDTDEPERCLRGKVNLPGAMEILFGPSVTISFTGDQVTVTHHSVPTAAALTQTQVSPDLVTASKLDPSSVRLLNQKYILQLTPINTGGKNIGCSQMYRAFTVEHPHKPCLIKMPANLAGEREHLCSQSIKSEKQALSCLHHPHIINMIDQGFDAVSNREFYVLEWLDQTLEQVLGRDGANGGGDGLSAKQYDSWETFYIKIGHPLLQAISTCHRQGFVHRDIQPKNVMFTANGQLKVIDFGISRKVPSDPLDYLSLTEDHFPRRNHPFFAPEKDNNEFPFSQDVFGFALTALYCFDSKLTFPRLISAVEPDALFREVLERIKVPNSIKTLLQECISLNPAERPSNAQILISKLQKLHREFGLDFPGLSSISQDGNPGHVQSSSRGNNSSNATSPSLPLPPSPPLPLSPSSTITPSTAHSGHVYALGTIAYDFGDEARRDTFRQAMAAVSQDGVLLPPDPYDPRQMVDHLDHHPDQAPDLIWTLQLDGNTLYALDPKGPFAPATYEMFLLMLNGQLAPPTSGEFIDHISLPGKRTDRTVVLLSGEEVPVLKVLNPRGMYGWNVPTLVEAALATVTPPEGETTLLREGLTAFLQRVYHDLRNVGQTSRDRALNFAVTNTFQAAATFAEAIADRRQLDTIEVEKSPHCRMNSDCWDVLLTFYDPEDGKRSRQVFRFTLDVADTMPVTVGRIKRWAKPGKGVTG